MMMMDRILTRRQLLVLPALGLVSTRAVAGSQSERKVRAYEADIAVLLNLFTFTLSGTIVQEVDRAAGSYLVTMNGSGAGITARTEARGVIRGGRYLPTETRSSHTLRGRENRVSLSYDHQRGSVEYHALAYTFFLGRRRQVDDVVRIPPGWRVDDLISAELNFAANALDRDPDGAYRMTVVRRARPRDEGPDDVSSDGYRAELATVRFHAAPETGTGRLMALVDLTGFSSWARSQQPARVAFGPDRHLETVVSSLILGTTFTLRLMPVS
jgi:hypothetical protein